VAAITIHNLADYAFKDSFLRLSKIEHFL